MHLMGAGRSAVGGNGKGAVAAAGCRMRKRGEMAQERVAARVGMPVARASRFEGVTPAPWGVLNRFVPASGSSPASAL